jgi:hypothetical protein
MLIVMLVELLALEYRLGRALPVEKDVVWDKPESARGREGYHGRRRSAGGEEPTLEICLYSDRGCGKGYT